MKASSILILAVGAAAVWFLLKKTKLLAGMSPQSVTAQQTGGTQSTHPKDDFATTADDITSIFANVTKLIGGGTAQTAPKSL